MDRKDGNINIRAACFVVIWLLATSKAANGVIGITWGRMSVQRLLPSIVVDLLLQNGIKHCRIYGSAGDIMQAFAGSGIDLTITIFNIYLIKNDAAADAFVRDRILPYYGPVKIRRIYISNYVLQYANHNQTIHDAAIKTLVLMQRSLNRVGLGDHVKATMTHSYLIIKQNITRPSEAEFQDEIIGDVKRIIAVLKESGAPFVIGIFPISFVIDNNIDVNFAFADNRSTDVITDVNGAVYTNAFDFVYDAFLWALEKAGGGGIKVVVDQLGWPTDGCPGADAERAERFYRTMIPKLASNVGTPKLPGQPIDAFLHSLLDETMMWSSEPWSRHWGIYRSNGEPKYKVDFSGQGRDIFPTRAKGIMHMPDRWCVFTGSAADRAKVEKQVNLTCSNSDCTSLAPGGSCSRLTYEQAVSYKYNMFFQTMYQAEKACDFDGLSKVVTENPSTEECVFPVEVVKGEQVAYKDPWKKSDGKRIVNRWPIFVIPLSILVALF